MSLEILVFPFYLPVDLLMLLILNASAITKEVSLDSLILASVHFVNILSSRGVNPVLASFRLMVTKLSPVFHEWDSQAAGI